MPHQTTIRDKQSKQIKLFTADSVPVRKRLEDRARVDTHGLHRRESKPQQILIFDNREPGLGIPLPKGTIRAYGKDSEGMNQFLGEDRISHTAVNDEVEILLGNAFDIDVERHTRDYKKISKNQVRLKRKIEISNGSKKPQTVELTEVMPSRIWSISQSNQGPVSYTHLTLPTIYSV